MEPKDLLLAEWLKNSGKIVLYTYRTVIGGQGSKLQGGSLPLARGALPEPQRGCQE